MTDLALLPAHQLAAGIAARRLSAVEVVDAFLARIERLEPKLQAFVQVNAARARQAAEAAHLAIKAGHAVGPLHGVPIAVKDLVEIEGEVATGGSAAWRTRVAPRTATLYRKLMAAGMVNLGKTHTVEFAFGGWGTNQHMGTPWNPWDAATHRTPGGSSSGSGVAVGARLAPWAIGTDTGGSVRIPAAWNGITGLKVTVGRISCHGVLPLSPTLDSPGPIARDVEDCALLMQLLQGADPLDPLTGKLPDLDPMPTLKRGVRGLRLGVIPAEERAAVEAGVLAAYDASVAALAAQGAEVVELKLSQRFLDLAAQTGRIIAPEIHARLGALAEDPASPLDANVRTRILGCRLSAADYLGALAAREAAKADFAIAFAGLDALLTPTMHTPPLPLAEVDQAQTPTPFTRWVNFLDLCGLAVPNGFTAAGLPSSLQVVCRGGEEALALRIGWAYQQAHDWHLRLPAMAG